MGDDFIFILVLFHNCATKLRNRHFQDSLGYFAMVTVPSTHISTKTANAEVRHSKSTQQLLIIYKDL